MKSIRNDRVDIGASKGRKNQSASVIVWDPSPLSLLALAGVLDGQGYRVVCARDSASVIESLAMGPHDLFVCDVGDDAAEALATLQTLRKSEDAEELPAVMIAESRWAGLEKKCEALPIPTRCLFKPIDPNSLIAVVDQLLWMPTLVKGHRRRGSQPSRPGWVSLE